MKTTNKAIKNGYQVLFFLTAANNLLLNVESNPSGKY